MTEEKTRPRVLCVDDEPNVLEGLALHLRRRHDVLTATSGAAGLEILKREQGIAVVMSDMRMPGMDGAAFLGAARHVCADTTRMLLTGHADVDAAISAVNEGQIFRFLTKPCPPAALLAAMSAAVEQNRLVTAERVLLEQTLHGSVRALTDVLALTSPACFGRATRIKQHVTDIATELGMTERWQLEVAAMLSQIGFITVPPDTVEKVYRGLALSEEEQRMVARVPDITEQLLGGIPRLEVVREILAAYPKPYRRVPPGADATRQLVSRAAQILRVAVDFDVLESQGGSGSHAIDTMRGRIEHHDPAVIQALVRVRMTEGVHVALRELPLSGLCVGMVIAEDVMMTSGALLVTRGYEVTASFVERAQNFAAGSVREPISVILKHA